MFARAVLTEAANSLSFIDAVHTRIQPDVRPGTVAFATLIIKEVFVTSATLHVVSFY